MNLNILTIRNIIGKVTRLLEKSMEPATVFSISVGAFLIFVTAISIYTAFGPPSKELSDPFDDHED